MFSIVCAALIVTSCAGKVEDKRESLGRTADGSTPTDADASNTVIDTDGVNDANGGSFNLAMPEEAALFYGVDTFMVKILDQSGKVVKELKLEFKARHQFSVRLIEGQYSVIIEGLAGGKVVLKGESAAKIIKGTATAASVDMKVVGAPNDSDEGDLAVHIRVPCQLHPPVKPVPGPGVPPVTLPNPGQGGGGNQATPPTPPNQSQPQVSLASDGKPVAEPDEPVANHPPMPIAPPWHGCEPAGPPNPPVAQLGDIVGTWATRYRLGGSGHAIVKLDKSGEMMVYADNKKKSNVIKAKYKMEGNVLTYTIIDGLNEKDHLYRVVKANENRKLEIRWHSGDHFIVELLLANGSAQRLSKFERWESIMIESPTPPTPIAQPAAEKK